MIKVGIWLVVDGVLDNVISNTVQSGEIDEEHVVDRAEELRRRGWEANAAHPLRGKGPVGWAPKDASFDLTLSEADLGFVRTHIEESIQTTRAILGSDRLAPGPRDEQLRSLAALEETRDALAQS